jgi:hypothetical protein
VAEVQVGRGGVEAEFDAQRLDALFRPRELLRELGFDQQLVDAALGDGERFQHGVGERQRQGSWHGGSVLGGGGRGHGYFINGKSKMLGRRESLL